jgi:hypothetical protein
VLQLKRTNTIKGKSAGLSTDPSVVAHLPSGISKDQFSGYAGFGCLELPDASQPNTWFVSTRYKSINDLKLIISFLSSTDKPLCCTDVINFIGCNIATLGI